MKRLQLLASLLGVLLSPILWAQATVYSYTGAVYTTFSNFTSPCATGPCANFPAGSRLTGQFSTAAPLASNLSHASISVTSFSFTDGLNSYSSANPNARGAQFLVSTDPTGNITLSGSDQITIELWQTGSSPHVVGDRIALIQFQPVLSGGSNNVFCSVVGASEVADSCLAFAFDASTSFANGVTGTWSKALASVAPIPTLSVWTLLLLSLALGGLGIMRFRKPN